MKEKQKYLPKTKDEIFVKNSHYIYNILREEMDINSRPLELLDIGCHKCFLKEFLPENVNYTGVNIDKTAEYVIEFDLNKGYLPMDNDKYDIIICTDVLEHLFCPQKIADEIKRCLKTDGIFIISLPNDLGLNAIFTFIVSWLKRKIDPIPTQIFKHHWKFSKKVAEMFLEKTGLIPSRAVPYYGPFSRKVGFLVAYSPKFCTTYFFTGKKKSFSQSS